MSSQSLVGHFDAAPTQGMTRKWPTLLTFPAWERQQSYVLATANSAISDHDVPSSLLFFRKKRFPKSPFWGPKTPIFGLFSDQQRGSKFITHSFIDTYKYAKTHIFSSQWLQMRRRILLMRAFVKTIPDYLLNKANAMIEFALNLSRCSIGSAYRLP